MKDSIQNYWEGALKYYGTTDWINKPTMFVEQIIRYFPKGGSVLELAAGQGQDSRYLAKHGFDLTCTDFSDFGLREAECKAKKEGLILYFQKVDLSKPLPFPDDAFDVVYSHLGLHYFTRRDTRYLFQEIQRILKPNGIFGSLFNSMDDPEIQSFGFENIEDHYYREAKTGLLKRYFTVAEAKSFIDGLFEPIILDDSGTAYKDGKTKLIRLVGKAMK